MNVQDKYVRKSLYFDLEDNRPFSRPNFFLNIDNNLEI